MTKLTLIIMLLPLSVSSQFSPDSLKFNPDNGALQFERVSMAPGVQNELFDKAKLWIHNNFKQASKVVEAEDREAGTIICKGNFDYKMHYNLVTGKGKREKSQTAPVSGNANFTLKVFVKDQKCKLIITDLESPIDEYIWSGASIATKLPYSRDRIRVDTSLTFESAMKTGASKENGYARMQAVALACNSMFDRITDYLNRKAENDF